MDIGKESGHCSAETINRGLELLARVTDNDLHFIGLDVTHAELKTDGGTTNLPLVEFVSRVVSVTV